MLLSANWTRQPPSHGVKYGFDPRQQCQTCTRAYALPRKGCEEAHDKRNGSGDDETIMSLFVLSMSEIISASLQRKQSDGNRSPDDDG